jgi:hypothetical protein
MARPKCSFVFPHAAGPEIDRDVALLTIALGVGATTLVYSVVYGALLAPLPYAQADRLVIVRTSVPDYAEIQRSTDVFDDHGIYASNQYMLAEEQILGGGCRPACSARSAWRRCSDVRPMRATEARRSSC